MYYKHPAGMLGLDTWSFDENYQQKNPPYSFRGINTFSAYPLFFIKYVRDGGIMTLEEAVQKTSTMTARVHNLEGRGVIKEGAYADITLMNVPGLKVLGDELEPRRYPEGIRHVFVNGTAVVEDGRHTGSTSGSVLTRV
jgi:N-acyl-D-amino-acid deacylase